MTQPNELPNYDRIVDNAELGEILNKACALLATASKNEDDAKQNYGKAEVLLMSDVVLENIKPTDVNAPEFNWTNPEDGKIHNKIKLAHTYPVEELSIGNSECTATPSQALFLTKMFWANCPDTSPDGETMLELWEKNTLQRKTYSPVEAAMVDAYGKKMKNFRQKVKGWLTPPKKKETKTDNQKFLDKVNAMLKFLQEVKKLQTNCEIEAIVKNVNNLKKHLS